MAILVTGAAGFIGFYTAQILLARGERVIGIDNLNDYYFVKLKHDRIAALNAMGGDFRFVECDFGDEHALEAAIAGESIDRIAHIGAQAGVRYSLQNPRAYVHSNLVGHVNILELGRQAGVKHIVYASSSAVYGGNDSLPFRVEDRVDQPLSLYAATKKADELMSESYAHLYRIPQTGLRFFTVYGPWGRPDMAVWLFTDAVLHGRPISVFNSGAMRRDFTYIDDIIAGVISALDNPPADDGQTKSGGSRSPHTIYNIGNNQSEDLGELIDTIEAACGRPAIRQMMPMQPGDVKETFADISAIQRELGFRPTTGIKVGIPRFVSWFRDYYGMN
jgi:UDP-glucuronate 4-epimerase